MFAHESAMLLLGHLKRGEAPAIDKVDNRVDRLELWLTLKGNVFHGHEVDL